MSATLKVAVSNLNTQLIIRQVCRGYATGRRRVVVTGIGVISPVGCTAQSAWTNIVAGACGVERLTDAAYTGLPCRIAAKIPETELKLENHFSKSDLRTMAPATAYALLAGKIQHAKTNSNARRIKLLKTNHICFVWIYSERSNWDGPMVAKRR